MKNLISILGAISGVVTVFGSALAMRFSGLTFIILLILELIDVINIGLFVIWYPLMMLLGGLFLFLVGVVITSYSADNIK